MDVHLPSEGAPAAAGEPGCLPLTQKPATDVDRRAFLELLRIDGDSYLEPTLRAMGSTWEK
jgi:hypothetical protein